MRHRPIVRAIATCAFCDGGSIIPLVDVAAALDADRGAGFSDPTGAEVAMLVQGDDSGTVPRRIRVRHPALDALLTMEMT